jgi:hypothetical protein
VIRERSKWKKACVSESDFFKIQCLYPESPYVLNVPTIYLRIEEGYVQVSTNVSGAETPYKKRRKKRVFPTLQHQTNPLVSFPFPSFYPLCVSVVLLGREVIEHRSTQAARMYIQRS